MEIWTILGVIAAIIGIPAAIVTVMDYFQKRREKVDHSTEKPKSIQSPNQTCDPDISKSLSPLSSKQKTLRQIAKLVLEAQLLTKQTLVRFESNRVYPEDCDLVSVDIRTSWDNYLLEAFKLLNEVQKSSEKVENLKSENRLLADSLYRETNLILEEVRSFRKICLENNHASIATRTKIRDRVSSLDAKIKTLLDQLP